MTGLFAALCILPAQAGEDGGGPRQPKLFDDQGTLELEISAPWRELVRNEKYQGTYPARLEYVDNQGVAVSFDITVERRGVNRQRVCKIPPLKLRFEKTAVKGTAFRGQDDLKMVTHCESADRYQQFYVLEMLAYRIYNLLSDFSFKVRPLTVTYYQAEADDGKTPVVSVDKKNKSEGPVFAFLIEEAKDVANRNDLKNLHIPRISPKQLDADEGALFSLFQYMIGNVDWAATMGPDPEECCHNAKLIGPEPTRPEDILVAVPYDFDSSGFVDSDYAVPPSGVPIRSVTQRLYRGYCAHNAALPAARQKILDHEQAIYDLVLNEDRLDARRQKKTLKYLEGFFEIMRSDKNFRKKIVEECR